MAIEAHASGVGIPLWGEWKGRDGTEEKSISGTRNRLPEALRALTGARVFRAQCV